MFIAAGRRDAFSVSVWTCWVTDVVAHARRISRTLQSASNNPYCDRQTTTDSQHKRWLLLSLSMHDRVILMRRLSDGHVIRSVKTYTSHDNSYCRTSAKMLTDIQCGGHVRTTARSNSRISSHQYSTDEEIVTSIYRLQNWPMWRQFNPALRPSIRQLPGRF